MPSAIIEVDGRLGAQQFDITLDGVDVLLVFFYAERTSSWYGEIRDPNNNNVIQGATRLAANSPFQYVGGDGLPVGVIFTVSGVTPQQSIRLRDLGDTAFLYYASPDDNFPRVPASYITTAVAA